MTDQQPTWHFKKLMAGEPLIDTVGGEFFSLEALKDEALPRETGQNSLDSNTKLNHQIDDDKKLILKLQFHETSKKTLEQSVFLKGLYQHSSNPDSGIPQHLVPQLDQKFKYLVIEDFNTTGVRGDMDFNNLGENQDQDLFNLFRSIGMTGKDLDNKDNLGSWGLGKNMYAQTSRLSSFLGYSCREHDTDAEFLFGMSILKLHKVDGTSYKNVGNFGHGDNDNESIIMPVTDRALLDEFKSEFNITREDSTDLGLSLVIPCIYDEITFDETICAFINTWALGIISEKMEIQIKSENENIELTSNTILDHVNKFDTNERIKVEKSINFLKAAYGTADEDYIVLNQLDRDLPIWVMPQLIDDESTSIAREKLESDSKVSFKVPVKIAYNDGDPDWGEFRVHIFNDYTIDDPRSIQFYRGALLIPGVEPEHLVGKGYHMIVTVEGILADVLAKSEGPAHYQWSDGISKYKKLNLKDGKRLINFVRNAGTKLKSYLNQTDIAPDEDIMSNILGFEISVDGAGVTSVIVDDTEPETGTPDPPDKPVRKPQPIWGELANGIYYKDNLNIDDEKMINKRYKVNVGYALDSGKASSLYANYQFDLSRPPIQFTHSGIDILFAKNNEMEFIVTDREWVLKIQGFDASNRDLECNIN